jgi:hypothetical protein
MHCFSINGELVVKIPKGQAEVIYLRTDNPMTKRERVNSQTTIYKTLHRKLKIEQYKPH